MIAVLLIRLAAFVAGHLPRKLVYGLARLLAMAWWPLAGQRRRTLLANLHQALPDLASTEIHRIAHRNMGLYLMAFADFLRLRPSNQAELGRRMIVRGGDDAAAVISGDQGAMVVSVHMGSWEVIAAAWAALRPERVSLMAEVLTPPTLEAWYVGTRRSMGINVIPLHPTALRAVHRALRQKHVIGLALDRDILGSGRPAQFFGRVTSIPRGALELAHELGTPLLPVFLVRDGDGYAAEVDPLISPDPSLDRDADAARMTDLFLRRAEAAIRRHPDQWHVLQPVWDFSEPHPAAAPSTLRATDHG